MGWRGRFAAERLVDGALGLLTALVFIALYAPIFLIAILSFFRLRRGVILWDTFSFEW